MCGSQSAHPTPSWAGGAGLFCYLPQVTTVGVQNEWPQDVPLCLTNYFRLKMIKAQKTQEEIWAFPLTA